MMASPISIVVEDLQEMTPSGITEEEVDLQFTSLSPDKPKTKVCVCLIKFLNSILLTK